jgi:hypothetical protein
MSHVSAELVCLARGIVARLVRAVDAGGSALHAALIASQLYEALKLELDRSRPSCSRKSEAIAAAVDRCCRAAYPGANAAKIESELREALALLEGGMLVRRVANGASIVSGRSRPRLRLIEGGRA